MVGSAGTRQPAESRSQACRRACPAHDAGVHQRPRLRPANSLLAVRVRGWRAVVKDVGVRPPNDGLTGRRPRMTRAHDRQKTLPTPAAVGARRACSSLARARSAPPSAATSPWLRRKSPVLTSFHRTCSFAWLVPGRRSLACPRCRYRSPPASRRAGRCKL